MHDHCPSLVRLLEAIENPVRLEGKVWMTSKLRSGGTFIGIPEPTCQSMWHNERKKRLHLETPLAEVICQWRKDAVVRDGRSLLGLIKLFNAW